MVGLSSNTTLLPAFLAVEVGDAVLIEPYEGDWWVGQVIHRAGGARCNGNSFFQIADVDSGRIQTVNPNLVTGIVRKGRMEKVEAPTHKPRVIEPRSNRRSQPTPMAANAVHRTVEIRILGKAL